MSGTQRKAHSGPVSYTHLLLPYPLQACYTTVCAAKYIWKGIGNLVKGKIEVPVNTHGGSHSQQGREQDQDGGNGLHEHADEDQEAVSYTHLDAGGIDGHSGAVALGQLVSLGEDGTRRTLRRLRCSNACIEETAVLVREAVSGFNSNFGQSRR